MRSSSTSTARHRRPRDRRADDERRALIERMLHGLYAATARALGGEASPPAAVADALVDAGLPLERSLLDRLGRRADMHRMAVRLRALQADEAAHAPDIVSIDPVERLAGLPGRGPAAEAARALLAAEANAIDPFGDPVLTLAQLGSRDRETLVWTVAGALAAMGGGTDAETLAGTVEHLIEDVAETGTPPAAAHALARVGDSSFAGALSDVFAHGQVSLGVALLARPARLRWSATADLLLAAGDAVAALVALAVPDQQPAARLFLLIGRGVHLAEERAADAAAAWLDLHDVLVSDPEAARMLLLPPPFGLAQRRVRAGARG